MNRIQINRYLAKIDELRKISGRSNEQVIRPAFRRLLEDWSADAKLKFVESVRHQVSTRRSSTSDYSFEVPRDLVRHSCGWHR